MEEKEVRRYQLESWNIVHFERANFFIGGFQLTEPVAYLEYYALTKHSIFVNIKLQNANIHFVCDKFEVFKNSSENPPVFEVTINKDGDIK